MSKQVESLDEIRALNPGDKILVRQDGTTDIVTWVKHDDHTLMSGEAPLSLTMFEGAVDAGNVFLPGNHHVGQCFVDRDKTRYYRIMARDNNGWVIAVTDSHGAALHTYCYLGEPLGLKSQGEGKWDDNTVLRPAWEQVYRLYTAGRTEARLAQILESGEIPVEANYNVEVVVTGRTRVTPSARDAGRMLGFRGAKVVTAEPYDVTWETHVVVTHASRWGCGCDQVTAEEVTNVVAASKEGAEVSSWSVTGCTPEKEGVESTVHTAA